MIDVLSAIVAPRLNTSWGARWEFTPAPNFSRAGIERRERDFHPSRGSPSAASARAAAGVSASHRSGANLESELHAIRAACGYRLAGE
jgi:hypothetical protein